MNRRALLGQAGEGRRIELVGYLTTTNTGSIREQRFEHSPRKPPLMARNRQPSTDEHPRARTKTPTFHLELPLQVSSSQAKRLRAHLEAARQLYNALLSEGQRRLQRMRADPAQAAARAIPRSQKLKRQHAFAALRARHGISLVRAARGGQSSELRLDRRSRGC